MSMSCKILCTLGLTSRTKDDIQKLFHAGANAFRLNFSHGTHEEHGAMIQAIREVEQEVGVPISIVADMQGAKFRIGTFPDQSVTLNEGDTFTFYRDDRPGDNQGVSLPHPEIFAAVQQGADLAVDDGLLRFTVTETADDRLETVVTVGGSIQDRKGVNVPGVQLPVDDVIPKDRRDITFACEQGVDWVALSFVQKPADVTMARKIIQDRAHVISKIEKPSAVTDIDDIIDESDAIMVARGDLGVEVPPEEVPYIQKKIVTKCGQAKKPVIVATQVLDSMIRQPSPTRAEISDIANAVYDGADVCMLSGETANGKYPVEAVTIMRKTIERAEKDRSRVAVRVDEIFGGHRRESAVISAICEEVGRESVSALVLFSAAGDEVEQCSSCRLPCPILCLTTDQAAARRLALVWGVEGGVVPSAPCSFNEMEALAKRAVTDRNIAKSGDTILIAGDSSVCPEGEDAVLRSITL